MIGLSFLGYSILQDNDKQSNDWSIKRRVIGWQWARKILVGVAFLRPWTLDRACQALCLVIENVWIHWSDSKTQQRDFNGSNRYWSCYVKVVIKYKASTGSDCRSWDGVVVVPVTPAGLCIVWGVTTRPFCPGQTKIITFGRELESLMASRDDDVHKGKLFLLLAIHYLIGKRFRVDFYQVYEKFSVLRQAAWSPLVQVGSVLHCSNSAECHVCEKYG